MDYYPTQCLQIVKTVLASAGINTNQDIKKYIQLIKFNKHVSMNQPFPGLQSTLRVNPYNWGPIANQTSKGHYELL
jgi:hypothetical protein